MARKPRKKKEVYVYATPKDFKRTLDPDCEYIKHNGKVYVGLVNGHLMNIQHNYTQEQLVDFINSLKLKKEDKHLCWLNLKNRLTT